MRKNSMQIILNFNYFILDDDDSSSDTDGEEEDVDRTVDLKHVLQGKPLVDKVSNTKETEAGTEISVLVNYCQSVQFTSFENAESEYSFKLLIRYSLK